MHQPSPARFIASQPTSPDLTPDELRAALCRLCAAADITPAALARAAGIAPSTMQRFLRGATQTMAPATLGAVSAAAQAISERTPNTQVVHAVAVADASADDAGLLQFVRRAVKALNREERCERVLLAAEDRPEAVPKAQGGQAGMSLINAIHRRAVAAVRLAVDAVVDVEARTARGLAAKAEVLSGSLARGFALGDDTFDRLAISIAEDAARLGSSPGKPKQTGSPRVVASNAAVAAPQIVSSGGDERLVKLGGLLVEIDDVCRRADLHYEADKSDASFRMLDRALETARNILRDIEASSATTLEGLVVKARAFGFMVFNEEDFLEMFGCEPTTDVRIAVGVLRDLLTIGGAPPAATHAPRPACAA